MLVSEKAFSNVVFDETVDESGGLGDRKSQKREELILIFRSGGSQFDFITNSIEQSQSEQFVEWWFAVWLDFIQNFVENNFVNLLICSVTSFFSIKYVHDALFIHFIDVIQNFLMDCLSLGLIDYVASVVCDNFVDSNWDLSKFKERKFIEILLNNCSDYISEKEKFFGWNLVFGSHSFQNKVKFIDRQTLIFNFWVTVLQNAVDTSGDSVRIPWIEAAKLLIEVSESVETGIKLEFLRFTLRSFQNRPNIDINK